jgi:NADPH-ferrihemoprotein reductase
VVKYGEGDDDGCMEDDFRAWEKILWPALTSKFGIDVSDIGSLDDQAVEYSYKIVYHDRETPAGKAGATPPESKGLEAKALTYFSKVTTVRELHNKAVSDRSCVHVELDISDCPLSYEAGDHVAVYPRNDPEVVRALCERLGYDRSAVFQLVMDKKDGPRKRFPVYCSVDSALGYYCDLTSAATVRFLKGCSELAKDEAEKAALKALGSTSDEGRARYTKEVLEPYLSVGDVLVRFKSVKLPLECFLELVSPLLPRYYSVASSPRAHPRALHLCASVVKYTTPGGRTSHGVATRHLSHLKEGDVCIVSVRRSAFKLPTRKAQPVIMIGPGTGLAPFRGFLQERSIALAQSATDHTPRPGKMILFNGCRRPDEDHIYADELAQYEKEGLVEVHTAFSRLGSEKVYVQHLLAKHGKDVWAALDKGASVYVCGDASHMAKDVDKALRALIKEAGGKTQDEADNYVKMLLDNNRYAQDVW